jgi:NAD(P)-dependent dehydrogenase (short-subunit alcohol dehydrogenase family)
MASTKKIIVVVGATGKQGGSVARHFLTLPGWHVRALTRDSTSQSATKLANDGAEIVQANTDDVASLTEAFQNAHSIFLNTAPFFGTYFSMLHTGVHPKVASLAAFNKEVFLGCNAAIAASGIPSLERLVYSGFTSLRHHGGYENTFHHEAKAVIVNFIQEQLSELSKKLSLIILGAYNTNQLLYPKLDAGSGDYLMVTPLSRHTKMPIVDADKSTGLFVRELIETEQPGVRLLAHDEDSFLSQKQIMDMMARKLEKDVKYVHMTTDDMHQQSGLPLELVEGLDYLEKYGYTGEGVITPDQLQHPPKTTPFEVWLEEQDVTKLMG